MTDEMKRNPFKAPPMPPKGIQMPSHKVEQKQVEGNSASVVSEAENMSESGLYDNNIAAELNLPPQVIQTKPVIAILAGVLAFGMMLGCVMGSAGKKTYVQGLGGVVRNPHVTSASNVRRCGEVDPNKECILYIMNAKKFDQSGEDFFQAAQDITGVQKYSIQLSNTNYANTLIPGGYIAQIYIPARR